MGSVHNPDANTAATRTVTPVSGERAHVDWICPSWSNAPDVTSNEHVTVTVGGTEVFRWRPGVAGSVQGPQIFGPWSGDIDEVIVVTVSAPTSATASLSIMYRENAAIT
jgi:hypothetical protein